MNALQNVGLFLVESLFSLYIGAVLLRFLLAWARANFYNPLSQFLVKVTNPVLVPLRRMIPAVGKVDTAAIVLALGLTIVKVLLLVVIAGVSAGFLTIVLSAISDLLRAAIWIYIFALIVQAVMSWTGNLYGNPLADLLSSLTEPLLRPIRQLLPSVGMVDLSPMVAVLLLNVVLIILQSFGL
ncbi:MAG: hypothetical protein RI964_2273 [Pseudomonadota bacterium]|jgi:YggT family protein